jgi:hypothetical protein
MRPRPLNLAAAQGSRRLQRGRCGYTAFPPPRNLKSPAARADAAGATFPQTACLSIQAASRGRRTSKFEDRRASDLNLSGGTSFGSKGPHSGPFSVQRRLPESNRCKRLCRARLHPAHSACSSGFAKPCHPLCHRDQLALSSASLMSLTRSCKFIASLGEGSKPKCS